MMRITNCLASPDSTTNRIEPIAILLAKHVYPLTSRTEI